jgi:uncharacterized protein YjbI with pentapeptide repeats
MKRPAPPVLPKRSTPFVLTSLDDDATLAEVAIIDSMLVAQQVQSVTIAEAIFKQTTFSNSHFRGLHATDLRFESCDLTEVVFERADLRRVEFIGCRLIGFQAPQARCTDVLLKGCNGPGAQFWKSQWKTVRFENCVLSDAHFQEADLSGAVFSKCDLRNAKMAGAKLAGANLCGSKIEGLKVGVEELRGAIVDYDQAMSIVRLLGITIQFE